MMHADPMAPLYGTGHMSRFSMRISKHLFVLSILTALVLLAGTDSRSDDLLITSGKKLSASRMKFLEDSIKQLRDADYQTRFGVIERLIRLDKVALPAMVHEIEHNTNPMLVRCLILALSEIGGKEAARLLESISASSSRGRDELIMAALGLGKSDASIELDRLRSLLGPEKNRFVRKAAALALARRKDSLSAGKMIKYAKSEREDELSIIFLLSALMAGGDDVIKAVPALLKSSNESRRKALILGAAFSGESVLLPALLKYGLNRRGLIGALAVCLGRFRSEQSVPILEKAAAGLDPRIAADALYSMTYQDEKKAAAIFSTVLNSSRESYVRAHCLLALSWSGFAASFQDEVHDALRDPDQQMRSAAALACRHVHDDTTCAMIGDALEKEKNPEAASDLLLVLGILGGKQYLQLADHWAKQRGDEVMSGVAQKVAKVMSNKMDPRILEELYAERLSRISGMWHFRLRDAVMTEIFKGLELDKIVRMTSDSDFPGSYGTGESGGSGYGVDPGSGNTDLGSGGTGEGGEAAGGVETPDEEDGGSGSSDGGTDFSLKKKKLFRYEVIERELLLWFKRYPYFPDSYFNSR